MDINWEAKPRLGAWFLMWVWPLHHLAESHSQPLLLVLSGPFLFWHCTLFLAIPFLPPVLPSTKIYWAPSKNPIVGRWFLYWLKTSWWSFTPRHPDATLSINPKCWSLSRYSSEPLIQFLIDVFLSNVFGRKSKLSMSQISLFISTKKPFSYLILPILGEQYHCTSVGRVLKVICNYSSFFPSIMAVLQDIPYSI